MPLVLNPELVASSMRVYPDEDWYHVPARAGNGLDWPKVVEIKNNARHRTKSRGLNFIVTPRPLYHQKHLEKPVHGRIGGKAYNSRIQRGSVESIRYLLWATVNLMYQARRIVLAVYGLAVAFVFLFVPWTENTGYWWLWSRPNAVVLSNNDILSEARRNWESDFRANDKFAVGNRWIRTIQEARPEDKNKVREQAKNALATASLRQAELSDRRSMSDQEVFDWLSQKNNFNNTFPEKANLDSASRQKLLDDWKKTVPPAKEWNERVQYAKVDYRRIGMELLALTALCSVGFVLSPRTPATRL